VKLADIGPDEVFHRYLTPKWAYLPLSGAGAAAEGGRFNRIGVEALYLSLAPQTALEEYRQGSSIVPPATIAGYIVSLANVVDLSRGYDPGNWSDDWADWDRPWRRIARIDKKTPPSWDLGDKVISAGHKGILFPSLCHPGGSNLVVFGGNLTTSDRLSVHDPDGRLPKDQSSWP
jgi:RES domain-containing protein